MIGGRVGGSSTVCAVPAFTGRGKGTHATCAQSAYCCCIHALNGATVEIHRLHSFKIAWEFSVRLPLHRGMTKLLLCTYRRTCMSPVACADTSTSPHTTQRSTHRRQPKAGNSLGALSGCVHLLRWQAALVPPEIRPLRLPAVPLVLGKAIVSVVRSRCDCGCRSPSLSNRRSSGAHASASAGSGRSSSRATAVVELGRWW